MDILFSGPLASLAGKNKEELEASLLNEAGDLKEDAANTFAKLVADKFKTQAREEKEQQYNRGFKAAKQAAEAATKPLFNKFGVSLNDFDKYEEAVEALQSKLGDQPAGGGKTPDPQNLTSEQIQKHPAFSSAIENAKTEVAEKWKKKYGTLESQFNDFKQSAKQKRIQDIAYRLTANALQEAGQEPLYGAAGQDKAIKAFWAMHGINKIDLDENENPILVNDDGTPLRDEMENQIPFDKFVKENWLFGFKEAAGNGSPPHSRSTGGSTNYSNMPLEEALKRAGTDPKKRTEILKQHAAAKRKEEQQ